MIIEETTAYAYKLKYIENVSFNRIRAFAQSFVNELPQELVDDIYEQLNRGLDLLQNEPQMLVYLYSFGNMHQAKLNRAFEQLPDAFLQQPEIRIVDYGCGQAIGTMCYADYLAEQGLSQTIKSVTLIEPSEICLKRAALHVSQFFPNAEIRTVCKTFDNLTDDDLANPEDIPTLHILSNVLDIQEFDLEQFVTLIANNLSNHNQFVCVGPYFNYSDKDERMTRFAELLNGNISYSKIFEKGELCDGKTWTAQIMCFSVGELEEEKEGLSTEVTDDENDYIIGGGYHYAYEIGVIYCKDKKRLLCCIDKDLVTYEIEQGTKVICNGAFYNCNSLQQIIFPNSVVSIGNNVFKNCHSLKYIIIPDGQIEKFKKMLPEELWNKLSETQPTEATDEKLDASVKDRYGVVYSFDGKKLLNCENKNLKSYKIKEGTETICDCAFEACECLQQITIPNTIKTIGNSVFEYCESLRHIDIPNSVTDIGELAFANCILLYQITIPDSVTSIKRRTFQNCYSLNSITIPNSIIDIGVYAFLHCDSLQQITLPNSITSIGDSAFCRCKSLQQISIPDSVIHIGDKAFEFCSCLSSITIPKSVSTIGKNPIRNCKNVRISSESKQIVVNDDMLIDNKEKRLIVYFGHKSSVLIPNYIVTIGDWSFEGCESLQHISIPNSVTNIEYTAFSRCKSLQQIVIPNSVTILGSAAFDSCTLLNHITFSNSLLIIPDFAFKWCAIQQITIPTSVTNIGNYAFSYCKSLRIITLPNSINSIGDRAFKDCKSLQQITIPQGTTEKFKKMLEEELWDILIEQQ